MSERGSAHARPGPLGDGTGGREEGRGQAIIVYTGVGVHTTLERGSAGRLDDWTARGESRGYNFCRPWGMRSDADRTCPLELRTGGRDHTTRQETRSP